MDPNFCKMLDKIAYHKPKNVTRTKNLDWKFKVSQLYDLYPIDACQDKYLSYAVCAECQRNTLHHLPVVAGMVVTA